MLIEPQYFSFKDPDATVLKKGEQFVRYIFLSYKAPYDHLMQSGLYDRLVKEQLLIPHQEILNDSNDAKVYKLILPEQIPFQSYPYEWSFIQWRKAILAFLKINQLALEYGMILKDASPFNFYLKGGKAILFDTSSFIFFKNNDSWLAYRQFCESFFSPLALMKYNGANWAKLTSSTLRGMPLKFVSKQLSIRSWLNLTCLLHIHLHATYDNKKFSDSKQQKGFSKEQLTALFGMFISTIKSWKKAHFFGENWINYYQQDIESKKYINDKQTIISEWLLQTKPSSVIDLGANTGLFSILASQTADQVIAAEFDDTCVDQIEFVIQKNKIQNITTLVTDLAETSPALGMLNKEYRPFIERSKSDLVMALALVHHLCIGKNLSMMHIAELFAQLSKQFAIVEFIPKTDNKVKLLLQSRQDIFSTYTEENFKENFYHFFDLIEERKIADSNRTIYLFKKK